MSKVSVIMPAFNAERFIAQSINSVIQQTYFNWELIIVDDGSTDSTASIIKKMQKQDHRIQYYYQSNKRQAAARNLGLAHSTGEWVAFLDADDLWAPTKLAVQQKYAKEIESDVFYTGGYIIDDHDKILSEYDTIYGAYTGSEMYKALYVSNPIPILSVIIKRSWIIKVGNQDEYLKIAGCEDWDYWIRLAYNKARFYGIKELLFKYRINPNGTSRKVLQMRAAECYALYKNLDLSFFNSEERYKVEKRFDNLLKFIIDGSYSTNNVALVPEYLKILESIKGNRKYEIARLIFKMLGTKSRRLVNFVLHH